MTWLKDANGNQCARGESMTDFLVTVHYSPGTPRTYGVLAVASASAARQAVIAELGYDPGVRISIRPMKIIDLPKAETFIQQAAR